MNFVGIDLHKKTISLCVVNQERKVLKQKRFLGSEPGPGAVFLESIKARQTPARQMCHPAWARVQWSDSQSEFDSMKRTNLASFAHPTTLSPKYFDSLIDGGFAS